MTLYMLFAGIGILIYAGVAPAEAAVSGLSSAHIGFDLQFAFLVPLSLPEGCCFRSVAVSAATDPTRLASARRCTVCSAVRFRTRRAEWRSWTNRTCEAIENPSATVAVGFPPVMRTFAGLLTVEELQALIEYVKSLSTRP